MHAEIAQCIVLLTKPHEPRGRLAAREELLGHRLEAHYDSLAIVGPRALQDTSQQHLMSQVQAVIGADRNDTGALKGRGRKILKMTQQ